MSASDPTPSPNELARLGGFEILEKIGEGGMGVVYRARQSSLDRQVALKVLNARLAADEKYLDSFRREARSAARLHHPNIIPVFDAGEADRQYYYAMEFVEGETLRQWVGREGALPEKMVLEITVCIANALDYAWDKEKIIHRDVKPENVMVDRGGNVKLCDLGLSKNFGENTLLTLSGHVHGTPQFMAPEQARAEEGVDFRADIYSLGMTLYYALTAEIPFHSDSPALVMARRMTEQLSDPREFAPDISESMCVVLDKMLAKDASDRYQSWDELLADIERLRSSQAPLAQPLSADKSTLRLNSHHAPSASAAEQSPLFRQHDSPPAETSPSKSRVTLAIVVVVVLLGGAGVWMWLRPNTPTLQDSKTPPPPAVAIPPAATLTPNVVAPPVTQPPDTAKLFRDIQDFIQSNPTELSAHAQRLRQFLTRFPNAPESVEAKALLDAAQTKLNELAAQRRQQQEAEAAARRAEEARKQEEARLLAEQRAKEESERAKAESAFKAFVPPFLAALSRRDYDAAEQMTKDAAANKDFAPLQERIAAAQDGVRRLKTFWTDLTDCALRLKGRNFTLGNLTGSIVDSRNGEIDLQVRPEAVMGVRVDSLSDKEVIQLAEQGSGAGGEALLNFSWFCFAAGQVEQASEILGKAQQTGVDVAAARELMASLTGEIREKEAAALIAQLNALVDSGRLAEARTRLIHLRENYGNTVTVKSAVSALAQMEGSVALSDAAARTAAEERNGATHQDEPTWGMAFSTDGRFALTGSGSKVKLWDVATGRELRVFEGHTGNVTGLAFSPDTKQTASGSDDGSIILWNTETGAVVRRFKGHKEGVLHVVFSADGKYLASSGKNDPTRLWDAVSGIEIDGGFSSYQNAVAISPDSRLVASSHDYNRPIRVAEIASGRTVQQLKAGAERINGLAFSPDNRYLLSGGSDRSVRLWELSSGKEVSTLGVHNGVINRVAFSPDGRLALSGATDKIVKLWDIATGKLLKTFEGHTAMIKALAFSPDGRYVLAGAANSAIKVWHIGTDTPASQAGPPVTPTPPRTGRELDLFGTFLGLRMVEVDEGLRVLAVRDKAYGAHMGVEVGDVITAFKGKRIATADDGRKTLPTQGLPPGWNLEVKRKNRPLTLRHQ